MPTLQLNAFSTFTALSRSINSFILGSSNPSLEGLKNKCKTSIDEKSIWSTLHKTAQSWKSRMLEQLPYLTITNSNTSRELKIFKTTRIIKWF